MYGCSVPPLYCVEDTRPLETEGRHGGVSAAGAPLSSVLGCVMRMML